MDHWATWGEGGGVKGGERGEGGVPSACAHIGGGSIAGGIRINFLIKISAMHVEIIHSLTRTRVLHVRAFTRTHPHPHTNMHNCTCTYAHTQCTRAA